MKRNKATNFNTSNHTFFSAAMKTLVFGILFKLFRLAITFAQEVYHLGIKMKTNVTSVLIFSLSPTANCPCTFPEYGAAGLSTVYTSA